MDERFIERTFPVARVSENSAREKNIRHGHISTLHIWWARRPLASSRATIYASLIPTAGDELEEVRVKRFIEELSEWENSLNQGMIERARRDIREYNGRPPRVLDPFGGGGSIPLEALRLGCETYSMDLNPVAVLIQKCTLEYPQRYGASDSWSDSESRLLRDVKRWGEWVLREAREELSRFYPEDDDGSIPAAYIWARTLPCQNPDCGAEVPLMRQYWLARKKNRKIALKPVVTGAGVEFEIVEDPDFDPSRGTISRAIVTCPVCGSTIPGADTRRLFQEGKAGERLIAVALTHPQRRGKTYRLATERDLEACMEAQEYLEKKRDELMDQWGIDPVPDEELPPVGTLGFRIQRYDMKTWGDLFNARQKLALITFTEKIRQAHQEMLKEGYEEDYSKAVVSYLGLGLDRIADRNGSLSIWNNIAEKQEHTFGRQALPMVWDYAETNVIKGVQGWKKQFSYTLNALEKIFKSFLKISGLVPHVFQGSAVSLPFDDDYFDAVFTDPPYYDNVPYSYLSDFFYVWLKRALGDLYPDLFMTPLTPKRGEMVAYTNDKSMDEAREEFESMLRDSFREIHRVLRPGGIANIVYAHKTTHGWETVINSILDSGLVVTASWPIFTEMRARMRAQGSAALASSIYIVARKPDFEKSTGYYEEVLGELKEVLGEKLDYLWGEGISGPDFFIAAIGAGLEVIGKYSEILKYNGEIVRGSRLLDDIRAVAADFAIRRILDNGFAEGLSSLTRFYLFYRWNFGNSSVDFDEARKLAGSLGIDLQNTRTGFIRIQRGKVTVLGPDKRGEDHDTTELIDALHLAARLWSQGRREELQDLLLETGYGTDEKFYRVAQAIIEFLPDCKEKQWLEGLTVNRDTMIKTIKEKTSQKTLRDY
ncbi:DUF1156 domain-containing protein [Methanothermobacter marburgensis]|uniref:Predicted DNA methylase n=1 Tax=Methanothermobacter marburgensis (strain ATCC BAA-927 / DSM 2133 / JCM 14651 / NBRC 100331 / OCM 82 / Marburg) TaxID=79929 RepID=D9PTY9_METTM|nr:DUF1156 domain-containing protein [Methanothermobacter marburgensis]ADL57687.1 predicted DNA methylase [Methanothermobacter marburgensis str. Marburg]WBF09916.1 DUF1156 domain-containing protein [Methanothermobacter marburgensis]